MPDASEDRRPPVAVAMEWVSRITTVSLEMGLPPWGGWWLDRYLHTFPGFVIAGAIFGLLLGMFHLNQMVSEADRRKPGDPQSGSKR